MDKRIKITIAITFLIVAIGLCLIWIFGDKLVKVTKDYGTSDLTFKADEPLVEKNKSDMDIYFENLTGDIIILGKKEDKKSFDNLEDFSDFVYNQKKDETLSEIKKKANFYYFTYNYKDGNSFYLVALYEDHHNYYAINFVCELEKKDEYKNKFLDWASSVRFLTN